MFFFFFFQAEDGIRDKLVTGVQTCALPISAVRASAVQLSRNVEICDGIYGCESASRPRANYGEVNQRRSLRLNQSGDSEIGRASCRKECRSRWSPYH